MKKTITCLGLILAHLTLCSNSYAVSPKRAVFFSDSNEFIKAYKTLSVKYNPKEQMLVSGPFLDRKTNEAFLIIEDKEDSCLIITQTKNEKISCNKAIKSRIAAQVPLLTDFSSELSTEIKDSLLNLNQRAFEVSNSIFDPYLSHSNLTYSSTTQFLFSPDLKSVVVDSKAYAISSAQYVNPQKRVRSIQTKKEKDGSRIVAIWIDSEIGIYDQFASKGELAHINPKILEIKNYDDFVNVYRSSNGEVSGIGDIKPVFQPRIHSTDYNLIVLTLDSSLQITKIKFDQSILNNGSFDLKL